MTSWRIASSSMPICSMSSRVRWAIGLSAFFWIVVMGSSLPGFRGGAAQPASTAGEGQWSMSQAPAAALMQVWIRTPPVSDSPAVTVVSVAGAQVAHGSFAEREDAAVADAHPAAARHQDAGVLGGVEDRGGAVGLDDGAVLGEGDGAALAGDDGAGAELLGEQLQPGRVVVGLQGVEQTRRGRRRTSSARRGRAPASPRSATSSRPCWSSYRATSRIAPAASSSRRLAMKIESGSAGRDVDHDDVVVGAAREADARRCRSTGNRLRSIPITGVMPEPAVTKSSLPGRSASTNSPVACSRWTRVPGRKLVHEVVADQPVGDGLDGDRDQPVGARAVGEGVGAPLADAVDVDADPDVLAGHVAGPVVARADQEGGGVLGLRARPRRSGRGGRRRGAAARRGRGSRPARAACWRASATRRRLVAQGARGRGGRGAHEEVAHVSSMSARWDKLMTSPRESRPVLFGANNRWRHEPPTYRGSRPAPRPRDDRRDALPPARRSPSRPSRAIIDEVPSYEGALDRAAWARTSATPCSSRWAASSRWPPGTRGSRPAYADRAGHGGRLPARPR